MVHRSRKSSRRRAPSEIRAHRKSSRKRKSSRRRKSSRKRGRPRKSSRRRKSSRKRGRPRKSSRRRKSSRKRGRPRKSSRRRKSSRKRGRPRKSSRRRKSSRKRGRPRKSSRRRKSSRKRGRPRKSSRRRQSSIFQIQGGRRVLRGVRPRGRKRRHRVRRLSPRRGRALEILIIKTISAKKWREEAEKRFNKATTGVGADDGDMMSDDKRNKLSAELRARGDALKAYYTSHGAFKDWAGARKARQAAIKEWRMGYRAARRVMTNDARQARDEREAEKHGWRPPSPGRKPVWRLS